MKPIIFKIKWRKSGISEKVVFAQTESGANGYRSVRPSKTTPDEDTDLVQAYQSVSFQSSVQDYLTTLPEGLNVTQHTRTTASGHFLILHFGNDNTDQNNNITGHHPSQQQDIKSDPDQVSTTHNIKQELVDDSTYLATNIKTEPTASYTSSSRLVKQETTSQRHVKPDPEQPAHFHGPASFNSPWRKHWYSSRNRSYRTKRFSQQKENSTTGQQTKETKKSTLQLPRLTPSRTASTDVNVYISRLVSGSYYR